MKLSPEQLAGMVRAARTFTTTAVEATQRVAQTMVDFGRTVEQTERIIRGLSEGFDQVGMYTAIVIEATFQGEIVPFLEWWISYPREDFPGFPDHPLFAGCDPEDEDPSATGDCRWYSLIWGRSAYFAGLDDLFPEAERNEHGEPKPIARREGELLIVKTVATLKNYGGEIEMLKELITPFVREGTVESVYETSDTISGSAYAQGVRRDYTREWQGAYD